MIPGAEEVLALLELRQPRALRRVGRDRRRLRADRRDAAAARPARGARLVHEPGLPASQRRVVKALRPVLSRAAGRADARGRRSSTRSSGCTRELEQVRTILTGQDASVRLVLTPETGRAGRGAPLATRRCRSSATASTASSPTGSSPTGGGDPWRAGWVGRAARGAGARCRQSFADVAVWLLGVPAPASRSGSTALADVRRGGVRRRATRSPYRPATGRCRSPAPTTGAVLRIAAALRATAGRRPRPGRRRAGRDGRRPTVVSSPCPPGSAGTGSPVPAWRRARCRCGSGSSRRTSVSDARRRGATHDDGAARRARARRQRRRGGGQAARRPLGVGARPGPRLRRLGVRRGRRLQPRRPRASTSTSPRAAPTAATARCAR